MIKVKKGNTVKCTGYLLDEQEYCEYQCLQQKWKEWNKILDDATDIIKTIRREENGNQKNQKRK